MKRMEIFPGVALNAVYSDKFKTDSLALEYVIPLSEKTAPLAALLPSVLKRGTINFPTMLDISKKLDLLYASSVGAFTHKQGEAQLFGFSVSFLRENFVPEGTGLFEGVLSMITELLTMPVLKNGAFLPEYVESEKKNLIDNIRSLINNKNSYAQKRMREIMCEGEAYAVSELGTEQSVAAVTPEMLYDFYKNVIATAPMEIYYVGTEPCEKVAERISKILPKRNTSVSGKPVSTVKTMVEKVKEVVEKMPVNQGKIAMGFRTGGSAAAGNGHIYVLMNAIFGGGVTSKLFLNVREKMSLCYYCSSGFVSDKGIIVLSSGINVENCEKAKTEILHQLDLVKQGDITDSEIDDAKRALANGYTEIYDDPWALINWYRAFAVRSVENAPEPSDYIGKINAVTKSEIVEAANTVLLDTFYFLEGTIKADSGEDEE